eukprot:7247614-Prymnesium_polylepis.1
MSMLPHPRRTPVCAWHRTSTPSCRRDDGVAVMVVVDDGSSVVDGAVRWGVRLEDTHALPECTHLGMNTWEHPRAGRFCMHVTTSRA